MVKLSDEFFIRKKLNSHFPSTTELSLEQTNIFWQFYVFLWNIVIGLIDEISAIVWYCPGHGRPKGPLFQKGILVASNLPKNQQNLCKDFCPSL